MESEDGWVPLGLVGNQLANLVSDFDPRTFGCRKLSDLVRKTSEFEIDHPEGGTMRIRVKLKPSGRSAPSSMDNRDSLSQSVIGVTAQSMRPTTRGGPSGERRGRFQAMLFRERRPF